MATLRDSESLEHNLVTLFEKLDDLRRDSVPRLLSARAETRTLEFWRSIISECLGSFFYVFTVCGAAAGVASGGSTAQTVLAASLAAGFSMAAVTQAFGHVSGAQVNPAVSVAMALTRNISLLRGFMFVISQCGGGIAGAALLYGVTVPGRQDSIRVATAQLPAHLSPWERFGLEMILSFLVVFVYFVTMDSHRKWISGAPLSIGSSYIAATIVSMPSLNPARALGPAFVMNRWDNHWVYWFGPFLGGIAAGLIYEFIFNPRRHFKRSKDSVDGDSSSIHSDEDTYDELDKPRSTYNTLRAVQPGGDMYRPVANMAGGGYCSSMTSSSVYGGCKQGPEPLYGGTKSMYCKSPPLTRANLSRSQSVYSKPPNQGPLRHPDPTRPGPLVPAHSLYPMRLNSVSGTNTNAANQNQQNQQRIVGGSSGGEGVYGTRVQTTQVSEKANYRKPSGGRPESAYVSTRQQQEPADSSYGSYGSGSSGPRYAPPPKAYQGVPEHSSKGYQTENEQHPSPAPPPPYHDQY